MPQTQSAKKALRASLKRRVINDRWRRKFREAVKAVNDAVTAGDNKKAAELYQTAQSNLDKASKHGVLHTNAANRKKSQLEAAIAGTKK